jgi:endonuclease YncB( thermonuclease family)
MSCLVLAAPTGAACKGEDGGVSVVTEINAGENLILEDGRAIRLIGILTPKRAWGEGPAQTARETMEKALAELTLGKKVSLQLDSRKRDRYGRVLAHVMIVEDGGKSAWVQARLVEAGLARVISYQDNRLCIGELLALEEQARQSQRGLWKSGFFVVRPAEAEDLLSRMAQSYEIIEGRVHNVANVRGRTYINFGRNWRQDFTAFIPEKSAKVFAGGDPAQPPALDLMALNGKQIRVRGWLKNYNGPSITVTHPEQIEVLGGTTAAIR